MQQKKSGCGPLIGTVFAIIVIFMIVFTAPTNGDVSKTADWYQNIRRTLSNTGQQLQHSIDTIQKQRSVTRNDITMSW